MTIASRGGGSPEARFCPAGGKIKVINLAVAGRKGKHSAWVAAKDEAVERRDESHVSIYEATPTLSSLARPRTMRVSNPKRGLQEPNSELNWRPPTRVLSPDPQGAKALAYENALS